MKLKENFIKAKGAVSCGALLINNPLQVQHLHYSGVTHSQGGADKGTRVHTFWSGSTETSLYGEGGAGEEERCSHSLGDYLGSKQQHETEQLGAIC